MTRRLSILTAILILANAITAQVKLSGKISDSSTNHPIDFANISLLQSDSVFVKGIESDSEGLFAFTDVKKGNYILSVSFMGYDKSLIVINNLEKDLHMDNIPLTSSDISLKDITVEGNSVIRKPDRQIILPTQAQIRASNNGMTLLRNLQLSRIIINPIDNTLSVPGGGNVQLRINGVEVSQAEITALSPSEIVRIEYHDEPGMRYNNAGAVLDYIVRRRESGGSLSTNIANAVSDVGWGENYMAAKYNHRKSEFSTNVYWSRRDLEWTRENYETFIFPDRVLDRIEQGDPTKVKFERLNASLNYNLQETDKYLFNVRFRNNYMDSPNEFDDRKSTLIQENSKLSIYDHATSRSNSPSLDIYYQRNLKKDQLLIFNLVGTYIDSKNTRIYQESRNDNITTDIYSHITGDKYSLIGEGIYEKILSNGKISGGIKHTQTYTSNEYSGNVKTNIGMNTAETYAYAEYQLKQGKFNYMFGLGGMRTYNSQAGKSNEKYIFRPTVRITYNVNDNLFFRYNGYISGYAPSLSDLNNVSQAIDSLQIRRGNPNLKTVTFYNNTITGSWNKGILGIELYAHYNYDSKPVMENVYYEDGKFIRTNENQKSFHRIRVQTTFRLKPYKDFITLSVTPFMNRYISYGNDYTHTRTNWGMRGSIMGTYKKWNVVAEIYSRYNSLWGESYNRGERFHVIMAGYNAEKWGLTLGMLNPFTKSYEIGGSNLSKLAPNKQVAYSDKLAQIFVINFTLNLNFGRQYKAGNKRLQNEDTDSGVLSGKK